MAFLILFLPEKAPGGMSGAILEGCFYFFKFLVVLLRGSWSSRKLKKIGVPTNGNFSRILRSRKRL